ncbi:MAG: nickel pincer cofactor biosynthesis protein LarC [Candidatus Hydrothermarchaeaceae archaeon]
MAVKFYIDPLQSGVSGNMLLGALIDAGGGEKKFLKIVALIEKEAGCKIEVKKKRVKKKGISALFVDIETDGRYEDICGLLKKVLTDKAERDFALRVAKTLLDAEAVVHGAEKVHLHELGSVDTAVDIAGTSVLLGSLDLLGIKGFSSQVLVGRGKVKTEHGELSIPPPVTAEILRRFKIPFYFSKEEGELATPTGVALLANLVKFEEPRNFEVETIGAGAGFFDLEMANVLRLMIGKSRPHEESVSVLETNVDDVSGEVLGYTLERLYEEGALDVQIQQTVTKKSRPGHVISVMCKREDVEKLSKILIEETGTLGIRTGIVQKRRALKREIKTVDIDIPGYNGKVRVKVAKDDEGNVVNIKPEYEDMKKIAKKTKLPLRKVYAKIELILNF